MGTLLSQLRAVTFVGIGLMLSATSAACLAEQQPIADVLKTAVGGTGEARYVAIDDLGERHEAAEKVVPKLQKMLDDKDHQVRWRSARALGDYGPQANGAAPQLVKLLAHNDPIVRYHAAVALGRIGDRSDTTIRGLVGAVTSNDERVARAAIAALRNLNPEPKHVMEVLEAALTSDDDAVTLHAMQAAVERGAAAVPMLNEALKRPKTAYIACAAIAQIGPEARETVPALIELLSKSSHSHLLIEALLALASIGPAAQSAEPQIVPLLETENDKTVPVAAAYALGSIGAADADAPLRQALAKDDPFLQMIAAWALAKIHPEDDAAVKQAVEKLTAGLRSGDSTVRAAAAKTLMTLHAQSDVVVPALEKGLSDSDEQVRLASTEILAAYGTASPDAVAALKRAAAEDDSAAVRAAAEAALARISELEGAAGP